MNKSMKKLSVCLFLTIVISISSHSYAEKLPIYKNIDNNVTVNNSHTVFVEYFTKSTRTNLPISEILYNLLSSEEHNFVLQTLIVNKNAISRQRAQEVGIIIYPTVLFDGGYEKITGNQKEEQYVSALKNCSTRTSEEMIDIDIITYAFGQCPGSYIVVGDITLINEGTTPFQGRLLVSLIEVNSRWNDRKGKPYSFAVLDYLFDQHIFIPTGLDGRLDKHFDWNSAFAGYGDLKGAHVPNLKVIVAVFSDETGWINNVVVANLLENNEPQKPLPPEGPTTGKINTSYMYRTRAVDTDGEEIRYCWDWDGDWNIDEWTEYHPSNNEIEVTHQWNKMGKYTVRVKAEDEKGFQSLWSDPIVVSMNKRKDIQDLTQFYTHQYKPQAIIISIRKIIQYKPIPIALFRFQSQF